MIELTRVDIESYNQVIETRNKVYCLMCDLDMSQSYAARSTSRISEVMRHLQRIERRIPVVLGFTKQKGFYYMHVYIGSKKAFYERNRLSGCLINAALSTLSDEKEYIDFAFKISNAHFRPNDDYLDDEREKLIQASSCEMLREIKQKNKELTKVLDDLKQSSRLIQTEKMRALGSMTAGVAHELNNPMMGILNFIQYCIKHTAEDDRRFQVLKDAEREVLRCQDIITNLLTFSRTKAEGDEGTSEIKPSALFDRVLQLIQYKLREHNVKVNTKYPEEEPLVNMKVNNVQQVILNLVSNAIDAMKDQKTKELCLSVEMDESNVYMRVKDTGKGMDEETIDKIFEPFFTTKKTGEGTGLGLAVSKSILEQHNGQLKCDSAIGIGTTFIVSLPINTVDNKEKDDD